MYHYYTRVVAMETLFCQVAHMLVGLCGQPHDSSFLILSFSLFAFPPARCCRQALASRRHAVRELQLLQGHHRYGCGFRMSEVHIYLIRFEASRSRPSFLISFFLLFSPTASLYPLLAGDIGQWHLPVGMKHLDLTETNVAGKTTSE